MSITICPVKPDFVAEVGDIDLSAPLCSADEQAVREAFARYAVLVFPAQALEVEQHLAFAGLFGPHERTVQVALKSEKLRVREEIADIANLDASGNIWASDNRLRLFQMGNRLWHTDSSFRPIPATFSLFSAVVVPPTKRSVLNFSGEPSVSTNEKSMVPVAPGPE